MVTIFTQDISPRLNYISEHIFRNVLGTDYFITNEKKHFLEQKGLCINYSDEQLEKGIKITPQGLLSQKGIQPVSDISLSEWNGIFCLFTKNNDDPIPFDLFAASFYLMTRYEEFSDKNNDIHGRFDMQESLASKYGFLESPIIDQWVYQLKKTFEKNGNDTSSFSMRKAKVISTFDIDHPFSFRNKGLIKNIFGGVRDIFRKDFSELSDRIKTALHLQEDPYFKALQWIDQFQSELNQPYYLFILNGNYEKYGRKTIYPLRRYYQFLQSLKSAILGLHPSYSASFNKIKIKQEKEYLEKKIGIKVESNRQHFLRIQLPDTYYQLDALGFEEDFTLVHAGSPGFRAGTSVPFHFYDFEKESPTQLLIRPTVVMDATLISYMNLSPDEALLKLKQLADTCKTYGNDFVMLWHNSNLAGNTKKNPWIKIFIEAYRYALSL